MKFLTIELYTYIKFFINLFALVNPIGMIPIFTSMTSHQSISERNRTNFITNFAVFIILSIALFLGKNILDIFGISINAFRIAGGILIVNLAMSIINGKLIKNMKKNQHSNKLNKTSENIGVIPLAMP
ncbi:NAAT family transporter, partial [Buchnera aphidicola (Hormaphis cornu)]